MLINIFQLNYIIIEFDIFIIDILVDYRKNNDRRYKRKYMRIVKFLVNHKTNNDC